jgi:rhamnosyltransferase
VRAKLQRVIEYPPSVIIRARDEAGAIGRCLELIARQRTGDRGVEVIVVDSGSRDGTIEIAHSHGARVLTIAREDFSFGRALNLGAAAAHGELLVALSAHAFPLDDRWLARLAEALADPRVACVSGDRYGPDGAPLTGRVEQETSLARAHPGWGYSNAGGAFRASLWRERPFREDLPGCEDLEWSRYWLERGYRCIIDSALAVEHDHTHDSLPEIYRRARREAEGLAMFADGAGLERGLLAEWWSDTRFYSSPLRARLSHRRAARLLGERAGQRHARSRLGGSAAPRGVPDR